ncbi:hypothetical protein MXD81_22660, partial [Microbacteriaceae bacterium K1510]|nr:hypothetical protein [Microbacteriaceae bacterium K1510]
QLLTKPPGHVGPFLVTDVGKKDGLKLLLEGGNWVLIRPSGTEPLLRVYCEATSASSLERIKEAVSDWSLEEG